MILTAAAGAEVPLQQRRVLLNAVPAFAALPAPVRDDLAARLVAERFPTGCVVVTEGEEGDRLSLVVEGVAEVAVQAPSGPVPVATLGPGELFGESALLGADRRRTATITALTPLHLLSLDRAEFDRLLSAHPAMRPTLAAMAEQRQITNFLKWATPFATLDTDRRAALAARLIRRSAEAGEEIVRQGEPGASCYLLRSGRVEVLLTAADGTTRRLATLGPGTLIGESALLTAAPRSATVRALERCDLLELGRDDLLATLDAHRDAVGERLLELVQLRARPKQSPGILAHRRATADAEIITTLKDPRRAAYYRLSSQGWFLWQRLDGAHTLRDLALDYFTEYKAFAPAAIADVVGDLARAGFVETPGLAPEVAPTAVHLSRWQRALLAARRVMEWHVAVSESDRLVTRLYRAGVRVLYTPVGQALLGLLAVVGFAAFLRAGGRVDATLRRSASSGFLLLFLVPALLFSVLIHEAGHAFTAKAFGHEVPRIGIGWYWFGPIAFVDTSDMWLASKWPRIAVSLAGPYANALLAAIAALIAWRSPNPILTAVLWQFALTSYLAVLSNLNPLLELDGYWVLSDWLDRPNLRPRTFAWLGKEFMPALRRHGLAGLRGHGLEVGYGLASLAFIIISAVVSAALYRTLIRGWLAHLLPHRVAAALAWVLAAVVIVLAVATLIGDLRGSHGAGERRTWNVESGQ